MEFLKELFTDGITYDEFIKKVEEKGYKLADLSKGDYVAKKKYDDDLTSANNKSADWEKKYNDLNDSVKSNDDTFQKKYDDLLNNYNTLKTDKEKIDKENGDYKKKELTRSAGITNERLVNLAIYELKDSTDFEKDVQNWAKENKNLLNNGNKTFRMSGNPDNNDAEDDKFLSAFYKSAGVDAKDMKADTKEK